LAEVFAVRGSLIIPPALFGQMWVIALGITARNYSRSPPLNKGDFSISKREELKANALV
jgi:hypothetical protein